MIMTGKLRKNCFGPVKTKKLVFFSTVQILNMILFSEIQYNRMYFSFTRMALRFVSGFHLHQMPTGV